MTKLLRNLLALAWRGGQLGVTKDIYAMRAIHYLLRRVYDYAFRWGYLAGRKECENYESANN